MRWTATSKKLDWGDRDDAYGLLSMTGAPTPAALAKQLFAQHVRYGDRVAYPDPPPDDEGVDAILAWDGEDRRSAVFVNTTPKPRVLKLADWDEKLEDCRNVLRVDSSTGQRVARDGFDGTISLNAYGVAVATNAADTDMD